METNGQVNMNEVAEILQDEVSVGYRPVMPLEAMWMTGGGDMPQITLRRDLEFMQFHPVVSSGLEYYKSGIAGAEFWGGPDQSNPDNEKGKPISPDPRVAQFVLAHVERFWQRGMPVLQEGGYPYGWAPGEHIYKEVEGMLVWSHLKGFHPNDGFILTLNHQSVGIRVKNIKDTIGDKPQAIPSGGTINLWFASESIPAKAAWYPHRPRFNQFYGRSQLMGAWRPWRRLGWRDAVEQVIDAAIYRAGYKGPIVRHPREDMQTAKSGIPGTEADSRGMPRRSARDVARQIVEWAKAGAGFTLSSEQYPQAQGGGPKWDIEWPDHVMDVRPLIEAAKYLEDQIMLGIGVPPELVKAGGTGSGYSGRSIPREAFLDGQQRVADAMLQIFVEQVVKPLVLWNFGDIPFEISCKPLLKSQVENKQGQPVPPLPQPPPEQEGGQQPPNGGQPPPNGAPPQQPPPSPAMSLDAPTTIPNRVLDIVRRVLGRNAALSTDATGREHRGKGKGGGQFVSKSKSEGDGDATDAISLLLDGDRDNAAKIVGAPSDARVGVEVIDSETIRVGVEHPYISDCDRTIGIDSDGEKFIHNDYFRTSSSAPPGFGAEMFARQVEQAREAGFDYIETHAAGNYNDPKFNGYYTWPRLGYDQKLHTLAKTTYDKAAIAFPDAVTVLDIFRTEAVELPEEEAKEVREKCAARDQQRGLPVKDRTVISGADWWLVHGSSMKHAVFNLTPGSRSMEMHEKYISKKKGKK